MQASKAGTETDRPILGKREMRRPEEKSLERENSVRSPKMRTNKKREKRQEEIKTAAKAPEDGGGPL